MKGSIVRRGERSWRLKFDLGRDGTGKRQTRYHTFRGTKKEAEAELVRIINEANHGNYVDPSKLTVAEFIERWLKDWAASNVSPKTFERYGEILRQHVAAHIGKVRLQKLSPLDLTQLYGKLLREGGGKSQGLSPRTVLHVHRAMHRALRHAVQWKQVQSNIASSTDAPKVADDAQIEVLDKEQVKAMMARLRSRNTPGARNLYTIVGTAIGTGMRRGELLALRWQDVDLERGLLQVERSLEQTKAGGLRFKAPKTKYGRRSIALPALTVTDLRAHRKAQQEARLLLGLGKAPDDALVFPGDLFEPRSPNALTKEWAAAAATLDKPVTFHALRHTHASQLIASGLDVLTISRRLGHGSPSITLGVYGHVFKDSDDRAVKALDAAFSWGTD